MGINIVGSSGGITAEVNSTLKAMRVSTYPFEGLGFYRMSVQTGLVTGLAANGVVFAFRNPHASTLVIPMSVRVGWRTITGFTAAQEVGLLLNVGRTFTTQYSAGGGLAAGTNGGWKKRTSYPSSVTTTYYSTGTAVVTGGTVTLDTQAMMQDQFAELATAVTIPKGRFDLNWDMTNGQDNPLILAQNEGLILSNAIAMGAGGTARISIEIAWAEASTYP